MESRFEARFGQVDAQFELDKLELEVAALHSSLNKKLVKFAVAMCGTTAAAIVGGMALAAQLAGP